MKTYLFAKYLTDDMRKAICHASYELPDGETRQRLADRTYCPLGVLHRDGLIEWSGCPSAPGGDTVALDLTAGLDYSIPEREYEALIVSVDEFICDWDTGRITPHELRYAVGLLELVK